MIAPRNIRVLVLALVAATVGGAPLTNSAEGRAQGHSGGAATPVVVAIRAAHHSGFDRIVFQFSGSLPRSRSAVYVSRLIADASGRILPVAGRATLRVRFSTAAAHRSSGAATVPPRVAFALPEIVTAVQAGDFEGVVSFGIGVAQRAGVHVWTLTRPSRVVIDIRAPLRTAMRGIYFLNASRFAAGTKPFLMRVLRPVSVTAPATALLDRLFAGPTESEAARSLRWQSSRATGFAGLSIAGGVARLRLTGGCSSGGSTFTIAQEISPTLKQLAGVRFVKIYDPSGHTEHPAGNSDSIPTCLEP